MGANPYLWVSQLILVTPLRVKSNGTVGKPARERKGTRNEPRQQSTCRGSLPFLRRARRERAEMSSMMPWGKFGAEPTSRIVLLLIRAETLEMETWYSGAGQATRWTLILK